MEEVESLQGERTSLPPVSSSGYFGRIFVITTKRKSIGGLHFVLHWWRVARMIFIVMDCFVREMSRWRRRGRWTRWWNGRASMRMIGIWCLITQANLAPRRISRNGRKSLFKFISIHKYNGQFGEDPGI